jgi:hypothetical protein
MGLNGVRVMAPHGACGHGCRQKGPIGNVAGACHGALRGHGLLRRIQMTCGVGLLQPLAKGAQGLVWPQTVQAQSAVGLRARQCQPQQRERQ